MPYANNQGTQIYWEEHGAGDPLLLIMGLGYTLDMWYRIVPTLAARYRTILFDNRGVGRSDAPAGPYPVALMASDAVAVLDAAGAERAHVFGASLGGMIAQELALQHPERVRSLVLGCTSCGGPLAALAAPEVLQIMAARATMTPEEGVRAVIPYTYDPATPRERIEEDLAVRLRTFPSSEGYLGQLQGVAGWETYSRLGALTVPTLVIHGESDRLVPPQNATVLAETIPGAQLVMLPHASHIFMTDQPEATTAAILSFLEQVKG